MSDTIASESSSPVESAPAVETSSESTQPAAQTVTASVESSQSESAQRESDLEAARASLAKTDTSADPAQPKAATNAPVQAKETSESTVENVTPEQKSILYRWGFDLDGNFLELMKPPQREKFLSNQMKRNVWFNGVISERDSLKAQVEQLQRGTPATPPARQQPTQAAPQQAQDTEAEAYYAESLAQYTELFGDVEAKKLVARERARDSMLAKNSAPKEDPRIATMEAESNRMIQGQIQRDRTAGMAAVSKLGVPEALLKDPENIKALEKQAKVLLDGQFSQGVHHTEYNLEHALQHAASIIFSQQIKDAATSAIATFARAARSRTPDRSSSHGNTRNARSQDDVDRDLALQMLDKHTA